MCEVDDQGYFTPAGFASSIGREPVTITFPNLPNDQGTLAYGQALQERFPLLPANPRDCVDLIKDLSDRKIIMATVSNAADEDDPRKCPLKLQVTISVVPRSAPAS